jgi:hypothetical protein
MEAACTSETSVDIQLRTRQYSPEDSELNVNLMHKTITGTEGSWPGRYVLV